MILIDSSAWLEFFRGGPKADRVAPYLRDLGRVAVPTLVLFEVYRKIKREESEEAALVAVSQMGKGRMVPLDEGLALAAADVSLASGLGMADSIILAAARQVHAKLVTLDNDFRGQPEAAIL